MGIAIGVIAAVKSAGLLMSTFGVEPFRTFGDHKQYANSRDGGEDLRYV